VALLPPRAGTPPLAEAITADVTVIGGGFAGLSAARRLAQSDPTLKVAVLEAGIVGNGPAGRNSGFIIDLPHEVSSEDYGGDSLHKSRAHIALQRRAVAFATELAGERGWGSDTLDPCGRYSLAMTADGDRTVTSPTTPPSSCGSGRRIRSSTRTRSPR
jgi:glycine/D-amino acid oxidase-like deaminating enzyme